MSASYVSNDEYYDNNVFLKWTLRDENGNHIIITYDCSYPKYYTTAGTTLTIPADFSDVCNGDFTIGSYGWYSDFSQFDSFKIDGTGDPQILKTAIKNHKEFYRNNILKPAA